MANPTIKHFVFSRFFPFQRKNYPFDILDVDFLSKQLPLVNNMFRSLENQTNKNFELIFISHPVFFEDKKYEFIFSRLRDSTSLPLRFMANPKKSWNFDPQFSKELFSLLNSAADNYDFVITTRMDFDDFIFKGAVDEAQGKINECDNLLVYGYNKGYDYIYGELYPWHITWGRQGNVGIFQSLILKSSFAKTMPCFCIENFAHNRIKPQLKAFLEENNVEFSENMVQLNTSTRNFIYFRHDFSQEHLVHNPVNSQIGNDNRKPLTSADITKKQLEEEFGFFHVLNSIK